jgi:hypothetical protein
MGVSQVCLRAAIAAAALSLGCAGEATPVHSLQQSHAAIRAAEEVGAVHVPSAALYLQMAREEAQQANDLIAHGHKNRAGSLLARAEADADLAIALSRESQERVAAQTAAERVRELKQQNQISPCVGGASCE